MINKEGISRSKNINFSGAKKKDIKIKENHKETFFTVHKMDA